MTETAGRGRAAPVGLTVAASAVARAPAALAGRAIVHARRGGVGSVAD